jgi:rubredoxin
MKCPQCGYKYQVDTVYYVIECCPTCGFLGEFEKFIPENIK